MKEKKLIKRIMALVLVGMLLIPTTAFAQDSPSKDVSYYAYTAEEIENSVPSIKKSWKSQLLVEEAEKQGVKVNWRGSERNVRVEIPVILSLDGAHAVFSDLQVTGGYELAFVFTERQEYSDYVTDPEHNALARLPFALSINFMTGEVTCHTAMALSRYDEKIAANQNVNVVIGQSDKLKAENLVDKRWDLKFNRVDTDTWEVSIANEKFKLAETDILDATSEIDLSRCYMAVNAWARGKNIMSLVINSCHSGENTCADDPANAKLLKTAINTMKRIDKISKITYKNGKTITELYNLYSNMPTSMQSLITNSDELMDAYLVYQVVEQIHNLGTITLDSEETVNKVFDAYNALPDRLKVRVSNLDQFTKAQTKLIKLKLKEYVSKPDEVNKIYKDRVTTITSEDVEQVVDVDGGIETTTINNYVTTTGGDGTQYLWIMFVVAGVVVLATAGTFFFLRRKSKKIKVEDAGNEKK